MGNRVQRGVVTAGIFLAFASWAHAASVKEGLIPLERYTSEKARVLARTYSTELRKIFNDVSRCLPWLSVFKQGLGFRTPRSAEGDDRYLSIWVWVDQAVSSGFAFLPPARRASGMFSRYGLDLLRRLSSDPSLSRDQNLSGYSVVLSWLRPGRVSKGDKRRVAETLAVFIDKATVHGFFARTVTPQELVENAQVSGFDGKQRVERLALEIWKESLRESFIEKCK
ncbi:MAG: hypothetical protein ACE5JD_15015 [Candidatus Methylomirabilia bacterium]